MTRRTPGALDDGRAIWSLRWSGACPAASASAQAHKRKQLSSKKKQRAKKTHLKKKKEVLPASPTPADWPYIGFDFVANAVGRYIPRL
jgi:hypothetical protein